MIAFPTDPLDVRTELQLAGRWTDISPYVYTREPITITQGLANEGTVVDPGRCEVTLNNRQGRFSPKNPMSPYYGLIGRNTPLRVSVPGPESYLALDGTPAATASTPHVAALGITGDLDVRVEATVDWYATRPQNLIGKWDSANAARAWMLQLENGLIRIRMSPDGALSYFAAWLLPALPECAALRVAVDIDNGTTWTAWAYWAPTLSGPWTPIGTPITGSVVIGSLYAAPGVPLLIAPTSTTIVPNWTPAAGRIHRAEVRSGIGGTVVAAPDFRARTAGTVTFTDTPGRTWSVNAPAVVDDRAYRFVGEVSAWPTEWDVSGEDVWTSVEASGILRRLGQGNKPLDSTLRRRVPSAPSLLAYWPMEDGASSVQAYSPVPGVRPAALSGVDWAANDSLAGSSALPKLQNPAALSAAVPRSTTAGWQVEMVYNLPVLPSFQTEILRVAVTGSVMRTAVVYASGAGIRLEARDADDNLVNWNINTIPFAIAAFWGKWNRLQLFTSISGTTTTLALAWRDVGANSWIFVTTSFTATMGTVTGISGTWGAATEGMALGHLSVCATPGTGSNPGSTIYSGADDGFAGETVRTRILRLADEEARLALSYYGDAGADTERLGPQLPGALTEMLQAAAETDGGILHEQRDALALVYRDRASLYNQAPALTLDYLATGEVAPPLKPVEDDQRVRNDVTVQRDRGSSGRVVIETGPMSVLPPEQGGIGIVDESVTLSLASDAQTEQIAGWRAHLGTADEPRYPAVHVQLHTATHLIPSVLALRIGDKGVIRRTPVWLPPGDIEFLVYGYTEVLDQTTWDLTMNAVPGGPWTVGVVDDPVQGRADTSGTVLAAAVTSTETGLELHTDLTASPLWADSSGYPGEFPFDLRFGGEVARVTALTNRLDQFTRTVANSWGTATSGQAWTQAGGLASDRSVTSGRGVITLPANISSIRYQQLVDAAVTDCEVRVRMSVSAVATGASIVPGVLLRCFDTSNFYRARIHFGTGGTMFVSVTRDTTQIGASPALPYSYAAGDEFELRVRLAGHTMQMRVWPVGTVEPIGLWHHTETVITNTIPVGTIGITASAFAGMTNVNLAMRFDNFEVVTPQLATIVRSANGITKPHAAGTDARLAVPTITAL
ncbi:hypothetical protein ACIBJC_15320 [Streptomyces sp. NPDC050509]|uniref:hypothetical protein n=1 Tax=Streptomyces sp. NPDC050509 TaxID=3365620 RepID=UPI0037B3554E